MPAAMASARRGVAALALLLAIGLVSGCDDDGPALSALSDDAVLLAFGDSITYGTGARAGESYPEVLEALIGRTVVRSGVPGEVSRLGLARLAGVLAEEQPDLVILCHGGNDILRRQSLERAGENLREMIRQIRDSGAEVVMLGVPRFGLMLETAPVYLQVAEEMGVPIEAEILPEVLADNGLKADAVHPNAEGYRRVAAAIQALLVEAGAL